jgi:adenosylhomocysteine nucleosidase
VTGVLFALEREAAPFRRSIRGRADVAVRVSGVGRAAARAAALRLIDEVRPDRVFAAGFCGALDPGLKAGDIVVSPRIVTVDRIVGTPGEKAELRAATGADAVDMESAAVEQVCRERGIEFVAVRAVSDTAESGLSPELVTLLSGGAVSVPRALLALIRRPSLLPEFLRLGKDTSFAARSLADALDRYISGSQTSRRAAEKRRLHVLLFSAALRLCVRFLTPPPRSPASAARPSRA